RSTFKFYTNTVLFQSYNFQVAVFHGNATQIWTRLTVSDRPKSFAKVTLVQQMKTFCRAPVSFSLPSTITSQRILAETVTRVCTLYNKQISTHEYLLFFLCTRSDQNV